MTALDYILDGLEAELELERELGVRTLEIDRSLLAPLAAPTSPVSSLKSSPGGRTGDDRRETGERTRDDRRETAGQSNNRTIEQSNNRTNLPLAFLHDRPLSPQGVEMMAKIVSAMHLTAETAPVVVQPPLPEAKVYVVLGGLAMKKYFPGMRGEPGQWLKSTDGKEVLITYSPAYILRFATVTPAVQKMKQDMWRSLKAVMQRLQG